MIKAATIRGAGRPEGALITSGSFPEVMASFTALTRPIPPRVGLLNRENSWLRNAYVS
jgi:hypothetical protein